MTSQNAEYYAECAATALERARRATSPEETATNYRLSVEYLIRAEELKTHTGQRRRAA